MKKVLILISIIFFSLCLASCKKDKNEPPQDSGDVSSTFPANTQWTGTMYSYDRDYAEPCLLKIQGDSSITIYSYFSFVINNEIEELDSIKVNIIGETVSDSIVTLQVLFPDKPNISGEATIEIINGQSINYINASHTFGLYLKRFTNSDVSVVGQWAGPIMEGQFAGLHAYPDLLDIVFNSDGTTTYWRNGNLAYHGVPQASDYYLIQAPYIQSGPMVWMDGYNESNLALVSYFGVFLASGDTLLVSSRDYINSRLPSQINGGFEPGPYGTSGYTPMIIRQE